EFHALDADLVDVDVLGVARVAEQAVVAEVGAGAHAAGLFAAQAGLAAGDLVLEVVAEQRGVEVVQAVGRAPVQRDLAVDAGLGLQVRVADEGRGALAAEADDAVVQVGGLGRLVARAHAALQGPLRSQVPDRVGARAELAAEHVVVVAAQAQGDGERVGGTPVVLGEQRPHAVLLHGAAAIAAAFHAEHAVLELAVDALAAEDDVVLLAQGEVHLGVERVLAAFHGPLRPRQEGVDDQLAALFAGQAGVGSAGADVSVVAVHDLVLQASGHGEGKGT